MGRGSNPSETVGAVGVNSLVVLGVADFSLYFGDNDVGRKRSQFFELLDEVYEARFLGDLDVVPNIVRLLLVRLELRLAALDLDHQLALDRSRVIVFELVQLGKPAVRLGHFALAFGDLLIDPLGQ
jgi:hypothetical protein